MANTETTVDVNKPIENPALVKAMETFFQDTSNRENELLFLDELFHAHFLVPVIVEGIIENGTAKKGTKFSVKMLTAPNGDNFFMAYTDWEQLSKWSTEKQETLILTYGDMMALTLKGQKNVKGAVINPFGHNVPVKPDLMEYAKQLHNAITVKAGEKILVGLPKVFPQALADGLSKFLKTHKQVEKAYILMAQLPQDQKPHLMLVLDYAGEKHPLFDQIAAKAHEFLAEDEIIDLIGMDGGIGKEAQKQTEPFYVKKRGFFQ